MTMGIKNDPATFQGLMDNVLTRMHETYAFFYLYNIIVHSESLEAHYVKVMRLFERLHRANLKHQPSTPKTVKNIRQFIELELLQLVPSHPLAAM